MTTMLLSDAEARAQARRTRTRDAMWQDLVRASWARAQAAPSPSESRRWLERAHRLLPQDGTIAIALATTFLQSGDPQRAAILFRTVLARHDVVQARSGLAAALHLLGHTNDARDALATLLQASAATDEVRTLATTLAGQAWCGLTLDGTLWAGAGRHTQVRIDNRPARLRWTGQSAPLPPGWQHAHEIHVTHGVPQAGSPLPIPRLIAVEGIVEAANAGLTGWAWHPADPGRPPTLSLVGPQGRICIEATHPADTPADAPLARPRRITVTPETCATLGTPIAVTGPDGRPLLGSPLDPTLGFHAAQPGFTPIWADVTGPPATAAPSRHPVDVVIPIYRGHAETMACLAAVLAHSPSRTRVIVVDDASPDPALLKDLAALARQKRILLLHQPTNQGFPAAANAGIARAAPRDVILLNSDTLVPPNWLTRLQSIANSAPDIGTVTPLSNDATILSYPDPNGSNPILTAAQAAKLDRLAHRANGTAAIDIPVGIGFCLYLRRACLNAIGPFRGDLFAQGYGEENDLCLRARHAGFRNVAAPGIFVAHIGGTSFGPARAHLMRRNAAILNRLHPGYDALIQRHLATDPLAPARFRLDAIRWRAAQKPGGAVIFITHAGGGGVERVVQDRAALAAAQGARPIILRPAQLAGKPAIRLESPGAAYPNLVFPMPEGLQALARLLRPDKPIRTELHHLLGHAHEVAGLARLLGTEAISVIHDYARFCPRIALVTTTRRYCGEPDIPGCEACIADLGSLLEDNPPVRRLLARSTAELAAADRVIAPSRDAARRIARHFPNLTPEVTPWEQDAPPRHEPTPPTATLRVAVIGAIGEEKGYNVLLACLRDARARALPIEFVLVGYSADDERLLQAGPAFITGEYTEPAAVPLIREQRAHVALIPSIWPETWCFALTRAWQAGLPAVVFDLGAQADRVRATGRGTVLPLGLDPARVNDALLRLATPQAASHSPPPSA